MAYFKEIVTKAVVGKGKKVTNENRSIKPENTPDTVLGCWIINHRFDGVNSNGGIYVNGSYDVNVWYSYDHDTKTAVASQNFSYSDKMNVPINNAAKLTSNSEVIVSSLSDPNVLDVTVKGDEINFNVRKEMGIEVVGDTKIRVNVEDTFDDYVEIVDDDVVDNKILEEIDNQVQEDYLDNNSSDDSKDAE